jgi:hypothetical protein
LAAEHNHAPTGTYTEWTWPAAPENPDGKTGYFSFEHCVTPEIEPDQGVGYFWSHQVAFVHGEAGYFGLQTIGQRPDGSEGKVAIFSIWNALAARGPGIAQRFGGEGVGFQTLIPYDWQAGRKYRLRLFKSGAQRKGTEWTAKVHDESTGVEVEIGTITVSKKWGYLSDWSVMWSERYTGPEIRRCADVGYSSVLFGEPSANQGAVRPESHHNHLSDPVNCPNSRIKDKGAGIRQEMGVPR